MKHLLKIPLGPGKSLVAHHDAHAWRNCSHMESHMELFPGKGVATAAADHLPLQRGQTTLEVKTRSDGVAVVCRCFGSMAFYSLTTT